jgi:uncharacterized protein YjbI with pentapeptide repeats
MDKQEQDQPWRRKPEIDADRQKYLDDCRKITPNIKQGIYPFKGIKLNRADVEWLLATHESAGLYGPVDVGDKRQHAREGLDVRGAYLQEEDLQGLPLARLRGSLTSDESIWCSQEEREMAAVHLQKASLERADLQKANLAEADLHKADLWGASLQDAYLVGANLQEVDLGRARLQKADLRKANLQKAHLAEAALQGADLRKVNLQGAELLRASLQKTNLEGADLQGAQLEEARLQKALLGEANLQEANLRMTRLQGAYLRGANLQKADLAEANLQKADLGKAKLQGADLRRAALAGVNFEGAIIGNKKQVGPRLVDCRWGEISLDLIEWPQVKLSGDEYIAYQKKDSQEEIKEKQTRLTEYETAVRANRQLAVVLRNQGLNEKADSFAYRAQVIQWQVSQLQVFRQLDRARLDLQKQVQQNQDTKNSVSLNISQFLMYSLYWPSFMLSTVKLAPENFLLKRVFLLLFQLALLFYVLICTPIILCLMLLLCMPLILTWLLGLTLSLTMQGAMMLLPEQRQRLQTLLTKLHVPAIERFKSDIGSAARQTISITQLFITTLSGHASTIFSMLLDVLAGYGYKPKWTLFWYVVTVLSFTFAYLHVGAIVDHHPLDRVGALIFSVTAFHGRGFFTAGNDIPYDSQTIILGAIEAVIGLLIELSFVATFTGRFFRR